MTLSVFWAVNFFESRLAQPGPRFYVVFTNSGFSNFGIGGCRLRVWNFRAQGFGFRVRVSRGSIAAKGPRRRPFLTHGSLEVDFFALFSSVAAMLGSPGQAPSGLDLCETFRPTMTEYTPLAALILRLSSLPRILNEAVPAKVFEVPALCRQTTARAMPSSIPLPFTGMAKAFEGLKWGRIVYDFLL